MAGPITVAEGRQASALARGNRCAAAPSNNLDGDNDTTTSSTTADRRWAADHRRFTFPRRSGRAPDLWFVPTLQATAGSESLVRRRTAEFRGCRFDMHAKPGPPFIGWRHPTGIVRSPHRRRARGRHNAGGDVSASSDEPPDRCRRCTPYVPAPVCRQTVLAACTGHRRSSPGKWTRDRDNR